MSEVPPLFHPDIHERKYATVAIIEVEYSETLAHPAAAVFAALANLEGRKDWQPDIVDMHVEPAGPAQVGTRVREARKIKGYRTEATLVVSVCEQNKLLVLESVEAKKPVSERYQIEDHADGTCRLHCRTEMDGVPKMAQYFVRQSMTKQIPDYVHQLTKLVESGT
jgi:Polyketide cyclase / dehydrase and lipid transport